MFCEAHFKELSFSPLDFQIIIKASQNACQNAQAIQFGINVHRVVITHVLLLVIMSLTLLPNLSALKVAIVLMVTFSIEMVPAVSNNKSAVVHLMEKLFQLEARKLKVACLALVKTETGIVKMINKHVLITRHG